MKNTLVMKFTDESSVTFQLSVCGPGEFGQRLKSIHFLKKFEWSITKVPKILKNVKNIDFSCMVIILKIYNTVGES